jgi:hypothetical protein
MERRNNSVLQHECFYMGACGLRLQTGTSLLDCTIWSPHRGWNSRRAPHLCKGTVPPTLQNISH